MLLSVSKVIIQLIFLILLTFLMFFLLEVLSRQILGKPLRYSNVAVVQDMVSDPILNHKLKPNNVFVVKRNPPFTIRVNDQSWIENKNITIEKPNNTLRVFYVGDSNVQSALKEESRMTTIVENGLNSKFFGEKIIDVINTGTASYSPLIYYLLIKNYILLYSPDLVVINVDMTDVLNDFDYKKLTTFDNNNIPLRVAPGVPKPDTEYKTSILQQRLNTFRELITNNSSFYYHFEKFVLSLKQTIKRKTNIEQYLIVSESNKDANWLAKPWTPEIQKNVDYSMFLLGETIKLLKENNVKVVLTGVPHYLQFTGEWNIKPHEELEKTAKKYDAHYLNTYKEIKNSGENNKIRSYYWKEDPTHFNEAGHKFWAQIQLRLLLEPKNAIFKN